MSQQRSTELRTLLLLSFLSSVVFAENLDYSLMNKVFSGERNTNCSVSNWPTYYPVTGTFWQATQPVSLLSVPAHSVSVSNFPLTYPVTGQFYQANQPVTVTNQISTVSTSNSSLVTTTNVLLVSVQIAAANPNRKAFYIWNNSSNSTYVTLGPTSVSSTPTRLVPTFATWEVNTGTIWTGAISAIRNAGSGTVTVYELQ